MKIVTFSDTHNCHDQVILPDCDICIFAGDFSGRGNRIETSFFMRWFAKQTQCKHKIIVFGNHDICFQSKFEEETHARKWLPQLLLEYKDDFIILNNNSVVIEGIKIWGSPASTWYHGERWAFNYDKADIIDIWEQIPMDADIVVTHGPAFGILDEIFDGSHVGCISLLDKLKEIKPKYHICGHIHESRGIQLEKDTLHINACILNLDYYPMNSPIEFLY